MKKGNKMSKMSNHVLQLEEQFYEAANDIIDESFTLDEALTQIELLRSKEFNFMDTNEVAIAAECAYYCNLLD
jgi:hypothetical protein